MDNNPSKLPFSCQTISVQFNIRISNVPQHNVQYVGMFKDVCSVWGWKRQDETKTGHEKDYTNTHIQRDLTE